MTEPSTASVSIVIPAHNEEDNLETVVAGSLDVLRATTADHEVVLVDDASTDSTWDLAQRLAAEHPEVRAFRSAINIGANGAIRMGMREARCDLIFFIPADLQVRPDQLPVCVRALRDRNADYICTNRVHRADSLHRNLMSWSYNLAVRTLLGLPVHDVDSSFLLRRAVFQEIAGNLGEDTDFLPVEMLVRVASLGYRITEVPVEHHPRAGGRPTSITPRAVVRTLSTMLRSLAGLRRLQRATRHRDPRHLGGQGPSSRR